MSFSIYSENLVDQSTLSASTTNLLFPVNNIKDSRRSKVFRSNGNSDSVVFDFNETSEVNSFFIVGDKRSGFGVSTITLQFNGTDSWGAPAASESITFSTEHGVGFKEFLTTHSYRFCRMVLTSTLGYCEISNVFLGKKLTMSRSINFGWSYKDNELSREATNRYGQKFFDIISRQTQITCGFSNLDKNDLDEFFKLYDDKGDTKPFFIVLGCDGQNTNDHRRYSKMYFLESVPAVSNPLFNKYNVSMSLIEAT